MEIKASLIEIISRISERRVRRTVLHLPTSMNSPKANISFLYYWKDKEKQFRALKKLSMISYF